MRATLARRQPDLAVVIEQVHDPHNVSAVLRSCEAVGAAAAHLVYPAGEGPTLSKGVSASAQRWLDVYRHSSIGDCYDTLREQGLTIYATWLGEGTLDLYSLDLTKPCAFVFGNESLGVSEEAVTLADATVRIPMMGMIESLNISVACAVVLYEALRQRRVAGTYDQPSWNQREIDERLRRWLERENRDPTLAALAEEQSSNGPPALNRYTRIEPGDAPDS
jgi:tRNA (guanosine-2'-O-)-methyltransferase